MFTFRYRVTENDYFEYILYHCYTVPRQRRQHIRQRYLCPVLFVLCGILFGSSSDYPAIGYTIFGIIAMVWLVFYRQIILARQIRKDVNTMKTLGEVPFGAEIIVTFGEEKIISMADDGELAMQYTDICKIVAGRNAFYFYNLPIQTKTLPYRVFAGNEEKDAFLRFLQQKTNADIIMGVIK